MQEDLKTLLKSVKKGDSFAMGELIQMFEKELYRFCYYLSHNKSLAEDLCQDTFLKCLDKVQMIDPNKNFRNWLFQIAKNLFLDHLKSPRNAKTIQFENHHNEPIKPAPHEIKDLVHFVLNKIDPEDRMAILLIDMEGQSYEDVSKIFQVSEETFSVRISRARAAFKAVLEENGIEITGLFKLPRGSNVA